MFPFIFSLFPIFFPVFLACKSGVLFCPYVEFNIKIFMFFQVV